MRLVYFMEKQQYTRQQIENSISYWTKKLHIMNETKSRLIDALIDEFGHAVVLQTEFQYMLNEEDLSKIFKILNMHLFNNRLDAIKLVYWHEDKIIDKLNQYEVESNGNDFVYEVPAYGVFSAIAKVSKDNDEVTDANFFKPIIMMNVDRLKKCIFIFAIACICHEMIHYYDNMSDEYLQRYISFRNTKAKFDSHNDKAFQEKMKEANSHGIDVVERYGTLDTFNSINNRARMKLFNTIGEDECNGVEHSFDGHTLDVYNEKTGIGCIIMFD